MGIYVRIYSWSTRLFLACCSVCRIEGKVFRFPHSSSLYFICFTSGWNTPVHPNLCSSVVLCILWQGRPWSPKFLEDLYSAPRAGWLLWKVAVSPTFVVDTSLAWGEECSVLIGVCLKDRPTFVSNLINTFWAREMKRVLLMISTVKRSHLNG